MTAGYGIPFIHVPGLTHSYLAHRLTPFNLAAADAL